MATWMELEQFAAQIRDKDFPGFENFTAPSPAEFDEGQSYWIKEYPIPQEETYRNAALPEEVDVVIIGSGITGASALYQLAKRAPELRVTLIEARGICTGATGRNGGHLCRPEAYDIRRLAEVHGLDEAVRLRQLPPRNRDMLLQVIDELGIADEVDLRLEGTTAVFGSSEEREDFSQDLDFARQAGMECEGGIWSPEEVLKKLHIAPGKAQYGAAYMARSGSIFPRKLVDHLIRHAQSCMPNLTIHSYCPVELVQKDTKAPTHMNFGYSVLTKRGTIRSRTVFHGTNAYANRLIPSLVGQNGVFGCKADVVAVQPNCDPTAASTLEGGLGYDFFWHWAIQRPQNGPFIYGWSGVEKLLDYDDSATLPPDDPSRNYMRQWLEESFPGNFNAIEWDKDVLCSWSGVMAYTMDGTSQVGHPSKDSPGEFMSVGHNGEGMGRCFACSSVVVDKLLHYLQDGGDQKPWSPPSWFPRAFLRNVG
ncbi:FAD dependent oxidoreductase [Dactylonectria macrodidyma]|uniref:FAD dependent oxidoreductase n=1 Tax=Dactylonectria macrodidyma TaxID=307937 RepID=A0A9P9DWJ7_9HYPO|nr:FAD dependent oxidoreductase [Dactylonectria macrodidyma]